MKFRSALSIACLLAPSMAIATNGFFSHGIGTGNKAMAGAGVALPLDSLAVGNNPAGMVHVGDRIDAGIALFSPPRGWKLENAGSMMGAPLPGGFGHAAGYSQDSSKNGFLVPSFGYNRMLDADTSLGVSVYANGGLNSDYDAVTDSGLGVFAASSAGVNWMQLFITPSYASRINDDWSWGAGLILSAQRIKVKGVGSFAGFTEAVVRGGVASKLSDNGNDATFGAGLKLGIQGRLTPELSVGASWQSRIWARDFEDYSDLFADDGDLEVPATMSVGLAWAPNDRTVVSFDVQHIDYDSVGAIANPVENLATCGAANPENCLGGSNGAGFGWEDMTLFKLGYQYTLNEDWTLRLGYSDGNAPIQKDQLLFNILAPAIGARHITAGFTHRMDDDLDLNFAAMYAPRTTMSGRDAFMTARGFPADRLELNVEQFELELGLSWRF